MNDELNNWKEVSATDVARLHRLADRVGITDTILKFAESVTFNGRANADTDSLKHLVSDLFIRRLNDEWLPKFRQVFRDKEIFGYSIIKYRFENEEFARFGNAHAESGSESEEEGNEPKPKRHKRTQRRITGFDVIHPWAVFTQYKYNAEYNRYDFRVYDMSRGRPLVPTEKGIQNIRVLHTNQAFAHGPHVTSTISQIAPKVVAYENLLIYNTIIMKRLAFPDWGTAKTEKDQSKVAEDLITYPSADGSLGHTATLLKADKQADDQIATKVAIKSAIDQDSSNALRNDNHYSSAYRNEVLFENLDTAKPIWAERTPLVLPANTSAFNFDHIPVPGNIQEIIRSYVNEIGAPFGLNHSVILGEMHGNSTHGQMLVSHQARSRLYAEEKHRGIADDMHGVFFDIHWDDIMSIRAERVRKAAMSSGMDPYTEWQSADIKFRFQRNEMVSYEDTRRLFDDKVIDTKTYLSMARGIFGIEDDQDIDEEEVKPSVSQREQYENSREDAERDRKMTMNRASAKPDGSSSDTKSSSKSSTDSSSSKPTSESLKKKKKEGDKAARS